MGNFTSSSVVLRPDDRKRRETEAFADLYNALWSVSQYASQEGTREYVELTLRSIREDDH